MNRIALPEIPLHNPRVWRAVLWLLFALAVLVRYFAYDELGQFPVGRMELWPATPAWFFELLAEGMVIQGDWLLVGAGTIHVVPDWMGMATPLDWYGWSGGRLPRGAPFLYLAAASFALTGTFVVYTLASLAGGGACVVLAVLVGERLFASRGAGVIAGVLLMASLPHVVAAATSGPWLWEALALLLILWTALRLQDEERVAGDWLLAGLALALAVAVRSIFIWGVILVPFGLLVARWPRPGAAGWIVLLLPPLLTLGGLSARHQVNGAGGILPLVGQPAWDAARTTHPGVRTRVVMPERLDVMESTGGRLPAVLGKVWNLGDNGALLTQISGAKLRAFLGSRDEALAPDVSLEYLRRRSEVLRLFTLRTDVTMAMAWAGLVFLLWRRRLPHLVSVVLAVLLLHAVLFDPTGMNRLLLHTLAVLVAAGAMADAARNLRSDPAGPMVLLLLYGAMMWALVVDDQARGTRYRDLEFEWAERSYLREGRIREAEFERRDLEKIRRQETLFGGFWNAPR